MATVDLGELIPDLEVTLSYPGQTATLEAVDPEEWLIRLRNAFWTAYLEGLITDYSCDDDGIVSHVSNANETFSRDMQQIVVIYCGINVVQNQLMQIKTKFKAKAGPVEYETEQSASILKGLLDSYLKQKDLILDTLANQNLVSTYYVDAVRQRDYSLRADYIDWNY
jgi:hypothetical protein